MIPTLKFKEKPKLINNWYSVNVQGEEYQQFKLLAEHTVRYISCSKHSQGTEMGEKALSYFPPLNAGQKACDWISRVHH